MKFKKHHILNLLFLFNRPKEAKKVFKIIAETKPKRLYLVSDGAREIKNEHEKKLLRKFILKVLRNVKCILYSEIKTWDAKMQ